MKQKVIFILESLATCGEHENPDLEMYFTVNLAFVDYLEELNESIKKLPLIEIGQVLNRHYLFLWNLSN